MIGLETRGLDRFEKMIHDAGVIGARAASLAINETAFFARRLSSVQIRKELNLSAGYIGHRLTVRKVAKPNDLEAVVRAEDRPTSLAQFSNSPRRFGRQRLPPRVKVAAGGSNSPMRGAFFLRLAGNNVGIAVRLKPGERVRNKKQMSGVSSGLYLLYGPSVGQAFGSIAEKLLPQISDNLEVRTAHHLERLLNG